MSAATTHEKLLREWQNRLGLQDWAIKLKDNCAPDDMIMQNVSGCTEWEESIKTARVEMLDEKFYGDRIQPYDYEKTLVQELLHLKTSLLSSQVDDLQERLFHVWINDLACALVDAKRCRNG